MDQHLPSKALAAAVAMLWLGGCMALIQGYYPLDNVELSPGHSFSLRADLFCEVSCGITYLVWDPAHELAPWSLLGFTIDDPGDLDWALRVSPDERWAGLADKLDPQVILALHDFDTGFDWPACPNLERTVCEYKALEGLSALQEPGGKPHMLSTHVGGDRDVRISP